MDITQDLKLHMSPKNKNHDVLENFRKVFKKPKTKYLDYNEHNFMDLDYKLQVPKNESKLKTLAPMHKLNKQSIN